MASKPSVSGSASLWLLVLGSILALAEVWRRSRRRRRRWQRDFAFRRSHRWRGLFFRCGTRVLFLCGRRFFVRRLRRRFRRSDGTRRRRHPDDICLRRFLHRAAPPHQAHQKRDMRQADQDDVSPKAQLARHRYGCSAWVAIPTFEICARCRTSITRTKSCTGKSRSGRITTATSGFASFTAVESRRQRLRVDRLRR